MRIIFILNKLDIGGPQKIVAFLANKLVENEHEVIIITYSNAQPTVELNKKIRWISLNYDSKRNLKLGFIRRFNQIPLLIKIRKNILSEKPDVLCPFTVNILRAVLIATVGEKIPIVSSERGNPLIYTDSFFKKARKSYSKCKTIVCQTQKVADYYDLPNIKVIPNPAINRLNCDGVDVVDLLGDTFITVGRLGEEKGHYFLVECFLEVLKTRDCRLLIFGSGEEEERIYNLIEKSKTNNHIVLMGEDSYVFCKYKKATAFILPSFTEGMPNALIEAMMVGLPCISTDCSSGGPRYLLKDGNAGFLVPVNDKNAMVNSIIRLLDDKAAARTIGHRGMLSVSELEPNIIYKKWEQVFLNAI